MSCGTLQARRGLRRHAVYLEECTHQLAADWLPYRHRRSANPHLLVSQRSALSQERPLVSIETVRATSPKGAAMDGLRQVQILDEALDKADPPHLMGMTAQTAARYIRAAYPKHTATVPRWRRPGRRVRVTAAARAAQPRRGRPSRTPRVSAPLARRPHVLTSGDRSHAQDTKVLGEGARSSISARRSLDHHAVSERAGSLQPRPSAEAPSPAV